MRNHVLNLEMKVSFSNIRLFFCCILIVRIVWMVYEQVLIARLDLGNTEGAKKIYFELKHKFGASSSRVQRLRGMILESTDVTGAKSLYKALREQDPLNQLYFKRLVCCEKADGNLKEAIKILLEYLDIHPSDVNAWEELAELYIKTEKYIFLMDVFFLILEINYSF